MLSGYVAPGGAQHLADLLALVAKQGAVGEWIIDLQDREGDARTFRLWAAARRRDGEAGGASRGEGAGGAREILDSLDILDILILGAVDADADLERIAARVPLDGARGQALTPLLAAIRARAAEPAALAADLRQQVRGLKAQVQPPPMIEHRLLGMAAHDLRNPLLVLSMGCSYLLHDAAELSDEHRSLLNESLDTCDFMNRLVDGMVDLADVAAGALVPSREPTVLAELVARAVQRHGRVADERGIAVDLVEVAQVTADVDPVRIGQVMNQLLSNAVTHCPQGTTVRVTLVREGGEAIFSVEDDGPGIAPEVQEVLFRPFGKPHAAVDPRSYGAGVGLAIARHIVEGHDGCIDVESEPGKGSRFIVTLPIEHSA